MSTIKFELKEAQTERASKWCRAHMDAKHPNGFIDCTGAQFRYCFIPTGLGDNIDVECLSCKSKITVTIDDDGDWCFPPENDKP